ncbi:MAG: NAD(P)-dependent alcohol dehydrogenase [Bacteroidales bacterium]
MKAIVCTKYGPPDVLKLMDIEKPFPKRNELLIKIRATSVTASDCIIRGFKLPQQTMLRIAMQLAIGFKKPRNPVLGMVLSGEVETIGSEVKKFKTGDRIYAFTIANGYPMKFGAYAQYISLRENGAISIMPGNASFEEAAAIPYGGSIAMHYLEKGKIFGNHEKKRKKVLVYGASGAIGTIAVQLAKHFGAEVSGVCSTTNLELVQSLGAEKVIDYTVEDFTKGNVKYDLILDAVGKQKSRDNCRNYKNVLATDGKFISVDDGSPKMTATNLLVLKDLFESNVFRPVIDKTYPLEKMAEAHAYVDKGHKKGNVVITIAH